MYNSSSNGYHLLRRHSNRPRRPRARRACYDRLQRSQLKSALKENEFFSSRVSDDLHGRNGREFYFRPSISDDSHTHRLARRRPFRTVLDDELLTVYMAQSGLPGRLVRAEKLIPSESRDLCVNPGPRRDRLGGGRQQYNSPVSPLRERV